MAFYDALINSDQQTQFDPDTWPWGTPERQTQIASAVNPDPEEQDATNVARLRVGLAPVMEFLHLFDKPRNALASAAYGGLYGADTEGAPPSFLSGLKQGALQTGPDISWGDIFGIAPPSGDMPWFSWYGLPGDERPGWNPGWLGNAGLRLMLDVYGDPLTYLFAPAKAAGLAPRAVRAAFPFLEEGQSLAGKGLELTRIPQVMENISLRTGINRAFGHEPGPEAQPIIDRSRWDAATEARGARQESQNALDALEEAGIGPEQHLDVYQALERPQTADLPQDIEEAFTPLLERRDSLFNSLNEARQEYGAKEIPNISDLESEVPAYRQMPHIFYGRGEPQAAQAEGAKAQVRDWNLEGPRSRELMRWENEAGEEPLPGLVSSANPKFLARYGIQETPEGGYTYKGEPISPTPQVSLKEVLEAPNLNLDPLLVQTNPASALATQTDKMSRQLAYFDFVNQAKKAGVIEPLEALIEAPKGRFNAGDIVNALDREGPGTVMNSGPQTSFVHFRGPEGAEQIAELPNEILKRTGNRVSTLPGEVEPHVWDRIGNFIKEMVNEPEPRQINVAGLEGFQAHPKTADYIENWAHADVDPSTPLGAIHDLAERIRYSRAGEVAHDVNTWWKRTTLARVARGVQDEVSRWPQLYGQAGVAPWDIPLRHADMWRLRSETLSDLLGDIYQGVEQPHSLPNSELRKALEVREVMGPGESGRYGLAEVGQRSGPGWLERNLSDIPGGQVPIYIGKKWGDLDNAILGFVRKTEEQHKGSAVLDWINKNHPDIADIYHNDPEQFEKIMDEAARWGHSTMGDYTRMGLNPTERLAIEFLPFWRWYRYIVPGGLETAYKRPQRLSALDRFYNTIFDTMSPEEYQKSEDWQKEWSLTKGMFGRSWDEIADMLGLERRADPRTLTVGRMIPYQHLNELLINPFQAFTSKITPQLKLPYELMSNKNTFLNRVLDPIAEQSEHGGFPENLIAPLAGRPYTPAWYRTFGMTLPAAYEQIYSNLPGAMQLKELETVLRGAGKTVGLPYFQDPNKNEVDLVEGLLSTLSGRKIYEYDPEKGERNRQWKAYNQFQEINRQQRYAVDRGDDDRARLFELMKIGLQEENPAAGKRPAPKQVTPEATGAYARAFREWMQTPGPDTPELFPRLLRKYGSPNIPKKQRPAIEQAVRAELESLLPSEP
jgi:hypothetical protein